MPVEEKDFTYPSLSPFFDGLLPEDVQLDGLLKIKKILNFPLHTIFLNSTIVLGPNAEESALTLKGKKEPYEGSTD